MISVDTKVYVFEGIIDFFSFYIIFLFLQNYAHHLSTFTPKIIVGLSSIPLFFVLYAFLPFNVIYVFIPIYYAVFKIAHYDWLTLNNLLLSYLIVNISGLVASSISNTLFHTKLYDWKNMIVTSVFEILMLSTLGIYIKKIDNSKLWDRSTQFFLVVVQIIFQTILYFFTVLAHHYGMFDTFINGVLIFVIIEFLIMLGLFIYLNLRSRQRYESKLEKQHLDNLQTYTKQLEQNQLKLRKFKHDYKNILLSITELAKEGDNEGLILYLSKLKLYSDSELQQHTDDYQDIQNIKDTHVKSLLLNKFFTMEQSQIHYHFECKTPINQINLNIIDIVRLLSILLDNAIEEAGESSEKNIDILIYKNVDNTTEITLTNTVAHSASNINQLTKIGFSSKSNHSGLGLSIVEDLKQKYPNLFIHFSSNNYQFTTQIIIN